MVESRVCVNDKQVKVVLSPSQNATSSYLRFPWEQENMDEILKVKKRVVIECKFDLNPHFITKSRRTCPESL